MSQNDIMFQDLPDVLSAQQLAVTLGVSRAGAYKLLASKDFPTLRIGGRKLVPKQQLAAWIEKRIADEHAPV